MKQLEPSHLTMHNPPHPGLTIKLDVLPAMGITVSEAAIHLGVSRVALSRMINGKASISASMAIRLSQWLGGKPEVWLQQQLQYDLWHAQRLHNTKIKPWPKNKANLAQRSTHT